MWISVFALMALFALAGSVLGASASGIEFRLLTPLSTYHSKPGLEIEAVLATQACTEKGGVLPEGAILRGEVKSVRKVGLGLVYESARLELDFRELALPDGGVFPVEARVTGVDSARERVDDRGQIRGFRATSTLSNRFGQRIGVGLNPLASIPIVLAHATVFRFAEPEIEYPSGAELYVALDAPDSLGAIARCPSQVPTLEEAAGLRAIVDTLPLWSYSKRQPMPSDAVNLLYIGSREQVEAAFAAARWTGSVPNSIKSGIMAVRAVAQDSVYPEAPMRVLLLDGAEPEMLFQKSFNTFHKRHHLRIWGSGQQFEGRAVWPSAATEDTGITFSFRRPFGFTHRIEKEIDGERDKVVRDLMFTGCVDSVIYVDRPPAAFSGESRKGMKTDGRVAVLILNSCESARAPLPDRRTPKPWVGVRLIRRITLTARNHFLRDNIFYQAGNAVWSGVKATRQRQKRRSDERAAVLAGAAAAVTPAKPPR